MGHAPEHPHVVVHPPALDGSRRVTEGHETLGVATHLDDVGEILRLADLYVTDVEDTDFIEWQGGGPEDWPGLSEHHEHHGQHEHHGHPEQHGHR